MLWCDHSDDSPETEDKSALIKRPDLNEIPP